MSKKPITGPPVTQIQLERDLRQIGVSKNMTLLVHSSLSSVGWVLGGASAMVRALITEIGETGTLLMPTATPHCGDPAEWTSPTIPTAHLAQVREHLPVFDLETTPTTLGAIPEAFRTWPGTRRSNHPLESVSARGPLADFMTADHPLAFSEGKGSPFEKLHDQNGWVLLIGVGFNRCTALHFAESLTKKRRTSKARFPSENGGKRTWVEVENVANDNDTHFPIIGQRFLQTGKATPGSIGNAPSILLPVQHLVDFAIAYFEEVL